MKLKSVARKIYCTHTLADNFVRDQVHMRLRFVVGNQVYVKVTKLREQIHEQIKDDIK